MVPLAEFMVRGRASVDPRRHPDEVFELFSIPAFDAGEPELAKGRDIGSSKQLLRPDDVLLSRIVPHIRRAWRVTPLQGMRQIGSGEWICFRGDFDPGYLRHFLTSDLFHRQLMLTVAGVEQ